MTETQSGVTTTYAWDARNRLSGITRTGLTASFGYDGLGRRKGKTINGTTTGFWYDGSDVYAELTGGTPSVTYIRGLSIDEPYIRKGGSDKFYETDMLGTSVALTMAPGQVRRRTRMNRSATPRRRAQPVGMPFSIQDERAMERGSITTGRAITVPQYNGLSVKTR